MGNTYLEIVVPFPELIVKFINLILIKQKPAIYLNNCKSYYE